jgi:uncharacterized membrane protein
MKRGWYSVSWILELLTIAVLALILWLPIQDFALREFKDWQRNPSPQTLKVLQDKRQDEVRLRLTAAVPFLALAALLALRLFRSRAKSKASNSPRL